MEPQNLLFPSMLKYCYTPKDLRLKRNITRLRNYIQSIINERRKGETKGQLEHDLVSILTNSEIY